MADPSPGLHAENQGSSFPSRGSHAHGITGTSALSN